MQGMISVIMLTYNRESLVPRAIESILGQTYRDYEFIIVDNGSTDRSGQIADAYVAKDHRVRVIHRGRGNIGSGRNAGLDAARGEYIAFIDDDDWVEPDFLELLLGLIRENDADVSICGTTDKTFDEKRLMTAEEAVIELLWRKRFNVGFPTKLICRRLFCGYRFHENSRFDDIYLMPAVLSVSNRVVYHGLPKYHVFRHGGNNSAWTTDHTLLTPEVMSEYLSVYEERTKWLCKKFPNSIRTWRYFEWSFMISMVEKVTRLGLTGCNAQREQMVQELWANREEFLRCPEILEFEKEWMEQYVPVNPIISHGRKRNENI